MNIQRATPVNELLAKLIFLILPTALIGYFLLNAANEYYALLQNRAIEQTLYFTAGMAAAALLYGFRLRFLPPFIGLIIVTWLIYKGLDGLAVKEFDGFFISVQFRLLATLFILGWLMGWGFMRIRYWAVGMAALMLGVCILVIAKQKTDTLERLLTAFVPVIIYSVYIIFTSEQIYNYKDKGQKFWWFLTRRLLGFGILAAIVLGGVVYLMREEIKETIANYGGGGKAGDNSMLQANKDKTFDLKDYSRLQSSLARDNELLFCAHIDNYFEGTDVPNPLYLTAFYYTKFDTLTETFEKDTAGRIPYNDLFEPDPSSIPLFSTQTNEQVIENSMTEKGGKVVEIEVYSRKLSPQTYLAPHTGYFVQPITVDRDFRDSFRFAFRAKSYVSELNSAYFIYNSKDEQIVNFQKERFNILRGVKGFDGTPADFMKYYTYMPSDAKFQRITALAKQVTANAPTPVDKVLAIRDWFLSKDEAGQPLFRYTDNPGVPDIPSASKLQYFLFENRKGYCAYFAGATLFMLRSLGIPSRIAVGFLTVERSNKNPGWYWYYADQAHAWVQVYFPGYGWLDFDTTVGNDEAQESPKPDGTPPMQPPKAWLAAEGTVRSVDTVKNEIRMDWKRVVFHDKEYEIDPAQSMLLDMHIAMVRRDSVEVPLSNVEIGDAGTAVSYADALKNMAVRTGENGIALTQRIAKPVPIDELYLKRKATAEQKEKPQTIAKEEPFNWRKALMQALIALAVLLLLVFLLPSLIMLYYRVRYANAQPGAKPYWAYRASSYYLHMTGMPRGNMTPMQYATRIVDPAYNAGYVQFMNIYLKQKYAKQELTVQELGRIAGFLNPFIHKVAAQLPAKQRIGGFLNPVRSLAFFLSAQDEERA